MNFLIRLLTICFTLCVSVCTFGQSTIDSLKIKLAKQDVSEQEKISLLNELGFEYWNVDSSQSLIYGVESLEIAKRIGDLPGRAKAYRILGVAYWTKGNLVAALQNLDAAKKQYTQLKDEEGIANTSLNSGMVYADLKDYETALSLYQEAINKFTALNKDGRIATTYTKIASMYLEQGQDQDAKTYLDNALAIHAKNKFIYGMAEAHNRLGIYFLNRNNLEQAFHHIRQSNVLGQQVNDKDGMVSNHILYGKLLRMQESLTEADDELKLGVEKARENSLKKYELEGYKQLKELKQSEGKLDSSIYYFEKYIGLKDSIFNSEKTMQVSAITFKNQLEGKDKELALLQEKERSDRLVKWVLLLGVIGVTVMGLIVIGSIKQRSKKTKELADRQEELLRSQEQLTRTKMENAELKQQELEQKLEYRNKELTSYTLNFVQKNEIFQQLEDKIKLAHTLSPKEQQGILKELARDIKQHKNIDRDWKDFRRSFEEVHTQFYTKLKEKHPDLSANDLKICSLTRLNLNIKETASILGISPESAKTARYRLRKKLDISPDEDLLHYFLQLEKE